MTGETPKNEYWWKCSMCGYTLQAPVPPGSCPSCKETCAFTDVTCYTPECGGEGKIDNRLVGGDKK
ncbi:MAG TPA: hypothetical protein PKN50_21275 [Spirochaetota bacterium]|nr:hypothetical protein [Spirochaetota bacterium]